MWVKNILCNEFVDIRRMGVNHICNEGEDYRLMSIIHRYVI